MQNSIFKIGAIILNDKHQLLVVRKTYEDRVDYIIPGGRQESGETDEQTLKRELDEELGVKVKSYSYFGRFEELAIFENVPLVMNVYRVKIEGKPKARSEIKDVVWVDRDYENKGYILGTVLSKHVIPRLVEQGEM